MCLEGTGEHSGQETQHKFFLHCWEKRVKKLMLRMCEKKESALHKKKKGGGLWFGEILVD